MTPAQVRSAVPAPDAHRTGSSRSRFLEHTDGLIVFAALLLGGAAAYRAVPGPDVSYLLYAADRLLRGARYGVDVVEVNPPLVVWLYMVPVQVGRLLGIDAHTVLVTLTLALIIAALILLRRFLSSEPERVQVIAALGVGALLLPGVEFGQREHLAVILSLPWIGVIVLRLRGLTRLRAVHLSAVLVGAIGLLLKPYFLLAWAALECVIVRRLGWRSLLRAENRLLVAGGFLYLGVVWLASPAFYDLALQLGPAYNAYLAQGRLEAVLAFVGAAIFAWYRVQHPAGSPLRAALEAGTTGFVLAAAVQLKWWPYHFLPAMILGLPCLVAARPLRRPRIEMPDVVGSLAQILALYLVLYAAARSVDLISDPYARENLAEPYLVEMREAIHSMEPQDAVLVLSTNIQSAFPLVPLSGRPWAMRLPSLWPIMASYVGEIPERGLIRFRPAGQRDGVERWVNDVLYEDVRASQPGLIFVLRPDSVANDSGSARRLDYIAYLTDDARFAEFFRRYVPAEPVGRYDVLVRRPD